MTVGRKFAGVLVLFVLGICVGHAIPTLKGDLVSVWYAGLSGSLAACVAGNVSMVFL